MLKHHRLTMLELIVLIIVLFLAVVILMPCGVFHGHSREKARRANCAGNLKQMGVAMLMYSGDFGGYFPPAPEGNSFEPLNTAGYLRDSKVYGCPSNPKLATVAAHADYWYEGAGLMDTNRQASETRLAFDMFGNHGAKANQWMNVLFVDGHVEGGKPGVALPFKNDSAVVKPKEEKE